MKRNTVQSWWKNLQTVWSSRTTTGRPRNRQRLELVQLECRTVPASVTPPTHVIANDDFTATDGNTAVPTDELANDQTIGAPINPSSVKVVTAPAHGTFTIDAQGDIIYTATGNFRGTDTLQYTVAATDGTLSNVATVTIVVNRPTANDDVADTDGTNPVTVDVLANDTDPDGSNMLNPASVKIVSGPSNGHVSIDTSNGQITYTANADYGASDTFQYTVTDKNGAESNAATVTIVVHRPTAFDDAANTTIGTPVAVNVLANDSDPDGNQFLDLTSVKIVSGPAHGSASVNHTNGVITYTPAANFTGTDTLTYTVSDTPGAVSNPATVRITVAGTPSARIFATGADAGGSPTVNVYNANGTLKTSFLAFASTFTGGVRVAVADVTGDGVPDIIVGAGPGGGPEVKVFDGTNFSLVRDFMAYAPTFTGGVNVAAGDINGDGIADIITGAGAGGGPHVKVFDGTNGNTLQSFFAYDATFTGGVNVAAGDVTGDGRMDIITGAGAGGGPHVKVFDGTTMNVVQSFFAYAANFTGGVSVAAADINGDGYADIITGAGANGGPHIEVFSGFDHTLLQSFMAFNSTFTGGVHVATEDVNNDGTPDILVSAGKTGSPEVRAFSGVTEATLQDFDAYDPSFLGGVYVGGA